MAIAISPQAREALIDAEKYARGQAIFAGVVRHGAAAIAEALEHAENVDTIDALEMAAREF